MEEFDNDPERRAEERRAEFERELERNREQERNRMESIRFALFQEKEYKTRNQKILIGIILLSITTLISYIALQDVNLRDILDKTSLVRTMTYGFSVLIITIGAFYYLQPSTNRNLYDSGYDSLYRTESYVDYQIAKLRESLKINEDTKSQFTDADRATILASIQSKLESEALQSYIVGIKEQISSNQRRESAEQLFRSIANRLGREVQDQTKRGNINLVLGMLTTLTGLTVLGYSVFYSPATQSPSELLAYFVPRISLVVLIEVFAYFFLRLYKQSLSEIKYFQNEITNIESRQLAIQFAERETGSELRIKIVEELMKTERNFLISKDQTTVDLERDRLARSTYSDIVGALKDVLKRKD